MGGEKLTSPPHLDSPAREHPAVAESGGTPRSQSTTKISQERREVSGLEKRADVVVFSRFSHLSWVSQSGIDSLICRQGESHSRNSKYHYVVDCPARKSQPESSKRIERGRDAPNLRSTSETPDLPVRGLDASLLAQLQHLLRPWHLAKRDLVLGEMQELKCRQRDAVQLQKLLQLLQWLPHARKLNIPAVYWSRGRGRKGKSSRAITGLEWRF